MTIVIAILLALIFLVLIKDKPTGWLLGKRPVLTTAAFCLFFISLCLYYFSLFLFLSDSTTSEQDWYFWPTILFWVFGFPALVVIDKGAMAKRVFYESRKEFFKLSFICLCSTGGFFVYVVIYKSTELWVQENKVLGYLICISIFSIPWLVFAVRALRKKQVSIRSIAFDTLKGIIFFTSLYFFCAYWDEIISELALRIHYFWVAKGLAIFGFIFVMFKIFELIDMLKKKNN